MSILYIMKRNIAKIFVCLTLSMTAFPFAAVQAEDDTDMAEQCQMSNIKTEEQYNACKAYTEKIAASAPDLQAQLDSINAEKASIEADIASYQTQLDAYQKDLDDKNAQIATLEEQRTALLTQIQDTQTKIDAVQKDIDAKQAVIDAMKEKIKQRMVNAQKNLRINNYIDILMGAKTFNDFIRIGAGLQSITDKEKSENEELVAAMDALNASKQTLKDAQDVLKTQEADLKTQEDEIEAQRQEVLVAQYKVQVVTEIAHNKQAELEASANRYAANIAEIQSTMSSISSALAIVQGQIFGGGGSGDDSGAGAVPDANGWVRPVAGGYRSAGTWTYPDGSRHLGYDFAVPIGTPIRAVGPGVVMTSHDGCPYGGLGSTCGGPDGTEGGGNQVQYVTVVNGSLYAVICYHMSAGTPLSAGTILTAGQTIGLSGSSGNSSGPHVHVAIIYLGNGTNFTNYVQNWNGDTAYGTFSNTSDWGYGRRCDQGYSAPCRIRPELIWGY